MRLIGRPQLTTLARAAGPDLRDAAHALTAELEAAVWRSAEDVRASLPLARFRSGRLVVDLDDHHCALVAINYEKGVTLVEFAGAAVDLDSALAGRPGERA